MFSQARPHKAEVQTATYSHRVGKALDAVLARTRQADETAGTIRTFDLATDRLILFSDQHKGARNGADDFRRSESAYNAALAYYLEMGHTLVVLGDAEELWEEHPGPVLKAYPRTFELEALFHQADRYLRIWGNHDDAWSFSDMVQRHLVSYFGPKKLDVHEGVRLQVRDGATLLGQLFLVHGHQGTSTSDRLALLSRWAVRFLWRPLQRLTRLSLNTPARDWKLRQKHNIAMYVWASTQPNLVLIAGHTHHPVFKSQSHAAQIRERLNKRITEQQSAPDPTALQEEIASLRAELEWVLAQEQRSAEEGLPILTSPCYFNTGCCCFNDGDITGIEMADGLIRLVRWPNREKRPHPNILATASLKEVFSDLHKE